MVDHHKSMKFISSFHKFYTENDHCPRDYIINPHENFQPRASSSSVLRSLPFFVFIFLFFATLWVFTSFSGLLPCVRDRLGINPPTSHGMIALDHHLIGLLRKRRDAAVSRVLFFSCNSWAELRHSERFLRDLTCIRRKICGASKRRMWKLQKFNFSINIHHLLTCFHLTVTFIDHLSTKVIAPSEIISLSVSSLSQRIY